MNLVIQIKGVVSCVFVFPLHCGTLLPSATTYDLVSRHFPLDLLPAHPPLSAPCTIAFPCSSSFISFRFLRPPFLSFSFFCKLSSFPFSIDTGTLFIIHGSTSPFLSFLSASPSFFPSPISSCPFLFTFFVCYRFPYTPLLFLL